MDAVGILIHLLVLCLIVYGIFWVIDKIGLPDPPKLIIKCIVGLIVILYLIGLLTGYYPYVPMRPYRGM